MLWAAAGEQPTPEHMSPDLGYAVPNLCPLCNCCCYTSSFAQLQGSYIPYASSCFAGPSESLLLLPLGKDVALVVPHDRQRSLLQGHTERVCARTACARGMRRRRPRRERGCYRDGFAGMEPGEPPVLRCDRDGHRRWRDMHVGRVCGGGGLYGDLQMWDLATGVEVVDLSGNGMQYMSGHGARVWDVKYRAGGMLVSASDDGKLKIWDARAGRCGCVRTLRDGGSKVWRAWRCAVRAGWLSRPRGTGQYGCGIWAAAGASTPCTYRTPADTMTGP